ncbi:MAG TPA: ketoacyl-ACP synthase III [Chryseosolibacter sp.]|nr:ketoacyl-ACP synthase III [Chryseosolibacter sp.]
MIRSAIVATGSYIPSLTIKNEHFSNAQFFEKDGSRLNKTNDSIIAKFQEITGIAERRYALPDQKASDLAFLAATDAIESSGIDRETLDYLIVAHNFGDIAHESTRIDIVPSLASRVKALLKIKNPDCVAYDLPFGCPGWVEGMIQANYFIRSGDAKRCLIIGTETLSRVIDPHDRDSMIYSDGSGAVILQADTRHDKGIISHKTQTFAADHAMLLNMDCSYAPDAKSKMDLFIKMNGRKVYEFALNHVPLVVKNVLDKAGVSLDAVSKVLIHQANHKMDSAILERIFRLYGVAQVSEDVMPMTIGWLGNSSVATVPTLLDLILKSKLPGHSIAEGDHVVMASVGAGMNINALLYRF